MSNIVNVAWMYPDILNLHGERGNAKAFELVSKNRAAVHKGMDIEE